VLVVGEWSQRRTASAEIFDAASNRFSAAAGMSQARAAHVAARWPRSNHRGANLTDGPLGQY
jgi:hypothetical protein